MVRFGLIVVLVLLVSLSAFSASAREPEPGPESEAVWPRWSELSRHMEEWEPEPEPEPEPEGGWPVLYESPPEVSSWEPKPEREPEPGEFFGTGLAGESGVNTGEFTPGDTIMVIDGPLRVRSHPHVNAEVIGMQETGTTGTLTSSGPRHADGMRWWHIAYGGGVTGWSAESSGEDVYLVSLAGADAEEAVPVLLTYVDEHPRGQNLVPAGALWGFGPGIWCRSPGNGISAALTDGTAIFWAVNGADCTPRIYTNFGDRQLLVFSEPTSRTDYVEMFEIADFDGDGTADLWFAIGRYGTDFPLEHYIASVSSKGKVSVTPIPHGIYRLERQGAVFSGYDPFLRQHFEYRYTGQQLETREVLPYGEWLSTTAEIVLGDFGGERGSFGTDAPRRDINFNITGDSDGERLSCVLLSDAHGVIDPPDFMSCTVYREDGTIMAEPRMSCRERVGFLETSTQGVRDLVCDGEAVFRWDGSSYRPAAETEARLACEPFDSAMQELFRLGARFAEYSPTERSRLLGCMWREPVDDEGRTPLLHAILADDPLAVRAFIEAGAEVNWTGPEGWSPLWLAVRNTKHPEIVMDLLAAGAQPLLVPRSAYSVYQLISLAADNRDLVSHPAALVLAAAVLAEKAGVIYGGRDADPQSEIVREGTQPWLLPRPIPQEPLLHSGTLFVDGSMKMKGSGILEGEDMTFHEDGRFRLALDVVTLEIPAVFSGRQNLVQVTAVLGVNSEIDGETRGGRPDRFGESYDSYLVIEIADASRGVADRSELFLDGSADIDARLMSEFGLMDVGGMIGVSFPTGSEVLFGKGGQSRWTINRFLDDTWLFSTGTEEVRSVEAESHTIRETETTRIVSREESWGLLSELTAVQEMMVETVYTTGMEERTSLSGTIESSVRLSLHIDDDGGDKTYMTVDISGVLSGGTAGVPHNQHSGFERWIVAMLFHKFRVAY